MNENKFKEIPSSACIFTSGEFELGTNGEGSKSAPIKLKARSGQPIDHWFWGRVVHDLSGMRLNKSRIPIDYVHDDKEIIGYLNKFDASSGDLIVMGALTPFKDSDRATEIIFKQSAGVPYEASINFGGDGIKFQEVVHGEFTEVNGYQFEGPGIIIREWPLRGVAVCPYGADANTESALFSAKNNKVFSATPMKPITDGNKMSESLDVAGSVEAEATEKEVSTEQTGSVEAEATPETSAEVLAVEGETAEQPTEEFSAQTGEEQTISRTEFTRIADEFGAEIAAETVRNGGNYESALKLAYESVKTERDNLAKSLSVKPTADGAIPVKESKQKKPLFSTGA